MKVSELKEKLSKEYDIIIDSLKEQKDKGIKLALSKETINTVIKVGQIKGEITIFSKDIVKE